MDKSKKNNQNPEEAYLILGGNIGNVMQYFLYVFEQFDQCDATEIKEWSSVYETEAWGGVAQANFLNLCVQLSTVLSPDDLLSFVLSLEQDCGRVREQKWGPRTLDIDILLYGTQKIHQPHLHIPHPYLLMRNFVLHPLAEIASEEIVEGQSIAQWAAQTSREGILQKVKFAWPATEII